MTAKKKAVAWTHPVEHGKGTRVVVGEDLLRGGKLTLRWWDRDKKPKANWRRKTLGRTLTRNRKGVPDPDTVAWAIREATRQSLALADGLPPEDRDAPTPEEVRELARETFTIGQAEAAVIDPATGKYPADSPHRREVVRELRTAALVWGADTPWKAIRKADLRKLWRRRIEDLQRTKHDGLRGAEVTIARVLAVAAWLRDEERIPVGACVASRQWKQELRGDWLSLTEARSLPEPKRPRHTLDEMRRILAKAGEVDPRFALVMALGAELRLGQVLRCHRSDVDLTHATLTVRGKGHKKGTVVKLTDGQMRVLTDALERGYLRDLEQACADFPLFPGGQGRLPNTAKGDPVATVKRHATSEPVGRSVLDDWFHDAERLAEVPVVKGRGAYGVRRAAVDAVKAAGISREGLKAHGGWSDTQVPDMIYADQEASYAADEARDQRAKLRGETP